MEFCEPFGEESRTVGKWQKLSYGVMFLVSGRSGRIRVINAEFVELLTDWSFFFNRNSWFKYCQSKSSFYHL